MGVSFADLWSKKQRENRRTIAQNIPKNEEKKFAYVVTGDETWAHYFEPVRKVSKMIYGPPKRAKDQ